MVQALLLAAALNAGVLSYPVHKKTLPNGLDVVVIETPEFKDVLSFNTLILAGSGREEEKGRTGLAHLFEHMLFRHTDYDEKMSKLGTHNNAWTWFDVTYYHPLTFARNLEKLAELEAGRFTSLEFSEKVFKTEAGAVLGEYRRGASFPSQRMSEVLAELQWPGHPYGHTPIGYREDVEDMPNSYKAARAFYETYYRPNNAVVVVAGDVKASQVLKIVEKRFSAWKRADIPPVKAPATRPPGERRQHVKWDADVAPSIWVSWRTPPFKLGSRPSAAAELLGELLLSPAAPLYKKLRYEKQLASSLGSHEGPQGMESEAPRAFTISAELFKDKARFDEAASDIVSGVEELKNFSKQPGAKELLETVKSKFRYDFLSQLKSPESVAGTFAWYYRFNRDPKALDVLLDSVAKATPEDIEAFAREHFTADNRAIVTMAYEAVK